MRILLDENLPRKLKFRLRPEHDAKTVVERGWAGVKNGELLRRAVGEFDVLLTMDRGIEYQQNVIAADIGIVVVQARSNDYDDLLPLVGAIKQAVSAIRPGHVVRV